MGRIYDDKTSEDIYAWVTYGAYFYMMTDQKEPPLAAVLTHLDTDIMSTVDYVSLCYSAP